MKTSNENIGLLCSSNGQGHSGGLEFHLFDDPIFSVPVKYLQSNYMCWCTATNIINRCSEYKLGIYTVCL